MIWQVLGGLVPSVGAGVMFWFVLRSVFRADQREREAMAEFERDQRAAATGDHPVSNPGH